MADLYLICGVPGSGKSTLLKNHLKMNSKNIAVSRDKIRFNLVKSDEPYFSKEKEVYKEFWKEINYYLSIGYNVFADQTSLTKKSRKYLMDNVHGYKNVNIIWMATPLNVSLERNNNRAGREFVPPETIKRMYYSFEKPSFEEGFTNIYKVTENAILRINKGDNNK